MTGIFWRPLPVMTLTIRQFIGGRAVRVVTGLGFLPALFALIYFFGDGTVLPEEFLDNIFTSLFFPTLLPITVLILATGALGNEIEDRTLPYLILKPLGRLRIVVEKWLGSIVIAIPAICLGLLATSLIALRGDFSDHMRVAFGAMLATAIGICAYTAIFIFVSLIVQRALLVGILYTFIWESILGRYLPGLRVVSVRHFVTSIYERLQNDPDVLSKNAAQLSSAIIVLAAATVVALLLSARRLRRMSLD